MDNNVIVNQLEKALKSKDDKELRLRVEVLVDMLKESRPQPIVPQPNYYETIPRPTVATNPAPKKQPKVNGPGVISSANSEQINYTRPKGT